MAGERLLYRVYPADFSGAELFSAELIAAGPDAVVSCSAGTPVEELMRSRGFEVESTPFRPMVRSQPVRSALGAARAARELRATLRARPELETVYATSARAGVQSSLAATGLGLKLVWGLWDPTPPGAFGAAVRRTASVGCDLAIACSEWTARNFAGRSARLRARTRVVLPGIRTERFESTECAPGAPRAITVGSLIPEKRVELAIEAARLVRQEVPGFELVVAGKPQYHERNREYARSLEQRAGPEVEFRGHVADVRDVMAGGGMLLHARPDEPAAAAVMEAMAAGLPIVAPASGGTPELVRDGHDGLLYEPGSAPAAARAVVRLIRDPALAARMGESARVRAQGEFSLTAWLDRHEVAYRSGVSSSR
jgi:glycosyltransferase involved in cell wall biosynthesis